MATEGKAFPEIREIQGLWDTGATGSAITQQIVDQLGLSATGRTNVRGVSGEDRVNTYLINLFLPNHVMLPGIRVTQGTLHGFDVLIGMDVISHGDFAITNRGGRTVFSFRMPSLAEYDFVVEIEQQKTQPAKTSKQYTLSNSISSALAKKK